MRTVDLEKLALEFPYRDVHDERIRAHKKHGENGSMEVKDWDHPIWLAVLTEEVGEVAHELCEMQLSNRAATKETLRDELVQVAAMAVAWIEAIDYAS